MKFLTCFILAIIACSSYQKSFNNNNVESQIYSNLRTFNNNNNNDISTQTGQVCLFQAGRSNSKLCMRCPFISRLGCANNLLERNYQQICDSTQAAGNVRVCNYCRKQVASLCVSSTSLTNGASLTSNEIQCIRSNCGQTIDVFFVLRGVSIVLQQNQMPFFQRS